MPASNNIPSYRIQHGWQSHVEIKDDSIVYFDCTTVLETLYCWTSVKGRVHMHFVDSSDILTSTNHIQALNESSAVQHFDQRCNWNTRQNNYTGLSHINSHVPYTLNSGNSLLDMNMIGSSKLDADIPGINFNKIRTQQFNQCGRLQMNSYKIVTIAEILSDI